MDSRSAALPTINCGHCWPAWRSNPTAAATRRAVGAEGGRAVYERNLATVRAHLDEAILDAAWAEGQVIHWSKLLPRCLLQAQIHLDNAFNCLPLRTIGNFIEIVVCNR